MGAAIAANNGNAPLARGCCTPRWLPAVRFIRCAQHPRTKGAPTIAGKTKPSPELLNCRNGYSREQSQRTFGPGVLHSAMAPCGPQACMDVIAAVDTIMSLLRCKENVQGEIAQEIEQGKIKREEFKCGNKIGWSGRTPQPTDARQQYLFH